MNMNTTLDITGKVITFSAKLAIKVLCVIVSICILMFTFMFFGNGDDY